MSFDVFVCHNSSDKVLARELAHQLKDLDISVWFDEWELPPGSRFQIVLEELVEKVRSVAILVGKNGFGPWHESEMRAFLEESKIRGIPLIPVILPGAPIDVRLPLFLREFAWVDCRDGFTRSLIERLAWGITGVKPGSDLPALNKKKSSNTPAKITSDLIRKNGKIPFRLLRKGGKRHFNLRIYITASPEILDKVTEVDYRLHDTFKQPRRVSSDRGSQFAIKIWTYGPFDVRATIYFEDGTTTEVTHLIKLDLPNGESNFIDITQ